MLARAERRQADRGVHVIGRGDHYRLDVLALVEHHPEILERLRLGERVEGAGRPDPVHVAKCDDVLGFHLAQVRCALAADADPGDVQLVARRRVALAQHVTRHDLEAEERRGCGS